MFVCEFSSKIWDYTKKKMFNVKIGYWYLVTHEKSKINIKIKVKDKLKLKHFKCRL